MHVPVHFSCTNKHSLLVVLFLCFVYLIIKLFISIFCLRQFFSLTTKFLQLTVHSFTVLQVNVRSIREWQAHVQCHSLIWEPLYVALFRQEPGNQGRQVVSSFMVLHWDNHNLAVFSRYHRCHSPYISTLHKQGWFHKIGQSELTMQSPAYCSIIESST